jgi:hypothetical protein
MPPIPIDSVENVPSFDLLLVVELIFGANLNPYDGCFTRSS